MKAHLASISTPAPTAVAGTDAGLVGRNDSSSKPDDEISLDAQEQPLSIQPIQKQPFEKQYAGRPYGRPERIGFADTAHEKIGHRAKPDESLPYIDGDCIDADDDEWECPRLQFQPVDHTIEQGEQEQAPAAGHEHKGTGP